MDRLRLDWLGLNWDELVDIEGVEEDDDDEGEEEDVKGKLNMRGEEIWRNDDSRKLHRRDGCMDGHVLRRYMFRGGKKGR